MDHYRRLGVRRDASTAEVRSAFHARVRSMHPDASGANDPAAFRDLVAAWHVLRDARARASYDASLCDAAAAPSPPGSRRPKTRVPEAPLVDVTMPHVWRPVVVACAVVVMAFLAVMVLIAFATPPPGS